MTEQQEFCLRWNDFHSNFHSSLDALRDDESFTDVTISCSGKLIRAHRVILSACSSHFKEILKGVPAQQHPVIVLPTVEMEVMQAIIEFIYQGQVNVRQSLLGAFLQVAETFSIQGLADEQTRRSAQKMPGRVVRVSESEVPPAVKRRRVELAGVVRTVHRAAAEPPAAPTADPPAGQVTAEVSGAPPATVSAAGPAADTTGKTVNISVRIKPESATSPVSGMSDILEQSTEEGEPMLVTDPDSDVVAQAMATIRQDAGDAAKPVVEDSLLSLHSLVTSVTSPNSPSGQPVGLRLPALRSSRSTVREFFTGTEQERVCLLCGLRVRLNKQLSTSGLWSHMRHRHPQLIRDIDGRPTHWLFD